MSQTTFLSTDPGFRNNSVVEGFWEVDNIKRVVDIYLYHIDMLVMTPKDTADIAVYHMGVQNMQRNLMQPLPHHVFVENTFFSDSPGKNKWVLYRLAILESMLYTFFTPIAKEVHLMSAARTKTNMGLATGKYTNNKQSVTQFIRSLLPSEQYTVKQITTAVPNDHVADAILLPYYYLKQKFPYHQINIII